MRLTDLDPYFLKILTENSWQRIDDITAADGISFLCPVCYKKNGNSSRGTHTVICWQPHVPQTISPKPGRWKILGDSFENLELKAGSSSVLLNGGCRAHFFIRGGQIIDC